jgi:hypothetical protein
MRENDWMSPEQFSEEYQIPVATVYQWRYRGVGPTWHKIGKHLRARRTDVDRWADEQVDHPQQSHERGGEEGRP